MKQIAAAFPDSYWMKGGCFDLACVLHSLTKLPIYGLYKGDDCHHAFVLDTATNLGIDARGRQPLHVLRKGCAGQTLQSMTVDQAIQAAGGYIDPHDLNAAKRYAIRRKLL